MPRTVRYIPWKQILYRTTPKLAIL
jgi:hypothetical protein